ncbi:MAG: lysophospholipid acyltransferase family protein [Hymenobacteraceae bacterium]|nr:lysophospholipid acyltransferase family protein [Hymenobacteraceae bacterium]MDX5395389.1 lysophospholipid acyltransferase family protein [Hymenobacteraceae bacterium]MDX5443694.1 lysophospholipid acyltransferase family protein [Hymenobacteraceae bacterium]MDX5511438.1 lysophospholipid acyltransferase family protein [Hymenobacteraceae bacterium]
MSKLLSQIIYKAAGWKLKGSIPPEIKKCVLVAAPHTSNWDFIYARAAFYMMGLKLRFTIKKEYMKFPFGGLMKAMGALPIDRSKTNNSVVQAMIDIINSNDEIVMLVTPEGTRKYQPRWRKGFYYAALGAKVPIVLGYMDYEKKEAGIGPVFYPTGDAEADIEKIKDFYRKITPKFPEQGVK